MFVEELFLTEKGSSFHSFGWATEKDLFPYDLILTAGTSSSLLDTDLRQRLGSGKFKSTEIFLGARPLRTLETNNRTLQITR